MEIEEVRRLPVVSLNHISLLCRSVKESVRFYEDVLGFVLIKRPSSFNFNGAWLYNYGIGIHLIENEKLILYDDPRPINPKGNHMSFECSDVELVKTRLEEMGMRYVTAVVEDEGKNKVDQVFFHDPDGYMIEICNCQNIPIIPLLSSSSSSTFKNTTSTITTTCRFFMENLMMENLSMDMINFSF